MPEGITRKRRRAGSWVDLGLMPYDKVLQCQMNTVQARILGNLTEDRILSVEHPPVFTLGKRGGEENLRVSKSFLISRGINLTKTDRGGNITYHGPGQAVVYPIVDLETAGLGVRDFVFALEEIMIQTALDFGVQAGRNVLNRGVWVGEAKLGSVGIAVKRGVSYHGLALNLDTDLTPFTFIHPCGLSHVSMTSLKQELKKSADHLGKPSMEAAKQSLMRHFSSILDYDLRLDVKEYHAN